MASMSRSARSVLVNERRRERRGWEGRRVEVDDEATTARATMRDDLQGCKSVSCCSSTRSVRLIEGGGRTMALRLRLLAPEERVPSGSAWRARCGLRAWSPRPRAGRGGRGSAARRRTWWTRRSTGSSGKTRLGRRGGRTTSRARRARRPSAAKPWTTCSMRATWSKVTARRRRRTRRSRPGRRTGTRSRRRAWRGRGGRGVERARSGLLLLVCVRVGRRGRARC